MNSIRITAEHHKAIRLKAFKDRTSIQATLERLINEALQTNSQSQGK